MKPSLNPQLVELLQQMHETEKGGVQIYETALQCVTNEDLKKEYEEYLEQTKTHVQVVEDIIGKLGAAIEETPGRAVVRHIGESLVAAMTMAKQNGTPEAAEIVATECVVFAETKDHLNWHLLTAFAEEAEEDAKQILMDAIDQVEDQEDEHLYHSKGWCRELWVASLGLQAVLPPPEEKKDVKSAIGAARAEQARKEMLKH